MRIGDGLGSIEPGDLPNVGSVHLAQLEQAIDRKLECPREAHAVFPHRFLVVAEVEAQVERVVGSSANAARTRCKRMAEPMPIQKRRAQHVHVGLVARSVHIPPMVLSGVVMASPCFVRSTVVVATFLLASCGSDSGTNGNSAPPEPLDLTTAEAPIDLGSIDAEYYEAIPYGPYEENLFDIYLPAAEERTPLLIYIHGGGFTGGSRDTSGDEERVLPFLAEGVAYASIDYRLLQDFDPEGVIKPLADSARCVQFIRYHAEQLNVDPERVILMGGSAGAGTTLWIGFNDDMADPGDDDPVLRQSTRVSAMIAIATQATYDIGKWSTVVFEEYNLDLLEIADALGLSQRLLDFYGISDIEDFDSPAILAYREQVDMLDLMDADDPPFYVQNDLEPAAAPLTVDLAFHHANHALVLAEQADEIGLENVAYIKALMIEDPSGEGWLEFALRHLGL